MSRTLLAQSIEPIWLLSNLLCRQPRFPSGQLCTYSLTADDPVSWQALKRQMSGVLTGNSRRDGFEATEIARLKHELVDTQTQLKQLKVDSKTAKNDETEITTTPIPQGKHPKGGTPGRGCTTGCVCS